MIPRIIKNEVDYEAALARIESIFDAVPGSPDEDELELLSLLVERYEDKAFPMGLPSPLAAIRFRMDQQGLKAKDLVPYLGSASKVSEVLSGKRPLSLSMIRNLVNELGIPAEVLLQEAGAELPSDAALQQGRHFPVAEMVKRGWFNGFQGSLAEAKHQLEDLLNNFVGVLGPQALVPALNRQHVRNGGGNDEHALLAWRIRVVNLALREPLPPYKPGTVTSGFLQELVRLSFLDSGPLLAKEFLSKSGIHLVLERHLPKTYLDGAALKLPDGAPVVALTLRYDRLDNFWFTLFHELAHVALHLEQDNIDAFFDDLNEPAKMDECEQEADNLATEALIPEAEWRAAGLTTNSQPTNVRALAERLRISPAIPAGRIRKETNNYKILSSLVGGGKLRPMFGIKEN